MRRVVLGEPSAIAGSNEYISRATARCKLRAATTVECQGILLVQRMREFSVLFLSPLETGTPGTVAIGNG